MYYSDSTMEIGVSRPTCKSGELLGFTQDTIPEIQAPLFSAYRKYRLISLEICSTVTIDNFTDNFVSPVMRNYHEYYYSTVRKQSLVPNRLPV